MRKTTRAAGAAVADGPDDEEAREEAARVAAERLGFGDFLIAGLLAAGVFLLQTLWQYPGIPPDQWDAAAVAAGVRPAVTLVPGFWHTVAGWVFSSLGVAAGAAALRIAGHAALALIVVFVYGCLREILSFVMRARPQRSPRRRLVMRIAAAIGAVCFAAADPVWSAGQFFGETTLLLALTVAAFEFFFTFLRKGTLKHAYICAIFLGLLSAETPAGLALLAAFITLNFVVIKAFPNLESPFFKPALIEVGKWHMTFFLLVALIAGVGFNCVGYVLHDGLVPDGASLGSLPLQYLRNYASRLTSAANVAGWILLAGFSFGPFIVSIVRFSAAADEENFLSYSTGIVFLFCGALALSQCASIPALWFWTYVPIHSSYLLSLCTLMCVLTVACAVTILGVDSLCRDHLRLARRFFGTEDESEDGEETVMSPGLTERLRALGIVIVPLLLVAAVVPGRRKRATREMLSFIEDVVRGTVEESGDARFLFTDGNLDAAVEILARAEGRDLTCVALMGEHPIRTWLRLRGIEDTEDVFSFKFDGAMGLRSWIRDKPDRLAASAVQVGFDLWKRDGKPLPPIGGFVSRPLGTNTAERADWVAKARTLAARVITLCDGGLGDCTDPAVRRAFYNAEWRLARMCLYRAEAEDLADDAEDAIRDMDLSKALNDRNETFQQIVRATERRTEQMMRRLTPREGLQLALVRADFTLGREFAKAILGADLENPDANFAMGMYHLQQRQLARAEEYLKRCLIRRPDEAAYYNNLAMVQLELGKLDAADANARRALELLPDAAAVRDTARRIQKAREEREEVERLKAPASVPHGETTAS